MMQPTQLTMFGIEAEPEHGFNVYHDESGTFIPATHKSFGKHPETRWLVHGMLFVPATKQAEIVQLLTEVRYRTNYYEELHYVGLRRSLKGAKGRCAQAWLSIYVKQLSEYCKFHALAVDCWSAGFRHERFRQAHSAYNYFAKMALVGGVAWFLAEYSKVALQIFSDDKFRQENDNFATYLPRELKRVVAGKRAKKQTRYPKIRMITERVMPANSNPANATPNTHHACELIQLVDLITSGISQALSARSTQQAKIQLAEIVADWVTESRRPPWLQNSALHRRFSLSCFPNHKGAFHNPSLRIQYRHQKPLFVE